MRIVTPQELDFTTILRDGDALIWGQACAEPTILLQIFLSQSRNIKNLSAFIGASFSKTLTPHEISHVKLSSFGALGTNRRLVKSGLVDIIPCHVGLIGSYIRQKIIGCDVVLLQLSPAGPDGRHSFGLTADYIRAAVSSTRIVIAEINSRVPWMHGEPGLHPEEIDLAIQSDADLINVAPSQPTEIDLAIAAHATNFIHDGSILQVGIGGTPDAIMQSLKDRKDLGIHSGMVGDSIVDLIENGIITNAQKPIDTGISITGALIGTEKLYDFADRNPKLAQASSEYTHNPVILAQLPKFVAINSAIEVDITGAVNAETIGDDYFGATGGQVDYVRAGHRSPGGFSIIALPATARDGISRIVANLSGPVTTARSEADVIITEFGAAELRGQTLAERARRMIEIAAPAPRDSLARAAFALTRRSG